MQRPLTVNNVLISMTNDVSKSEMCKQEQRSVVHRDVDASLNEAVSGLGSTGSTTTVHHERLASMDM